MTPSYIYNATIIRWVDGDTVDLHIDLGWHLYYDARCRLLDIDTPERGHPGWAEATAYNNQAAPPGTPVTIQSQLGPDKYGRLLVTIHVADLNLNQALLDANLAIPYEGGHKA